MLPQVGRRSPTSSSLGPMFAENGSRNGLAATLLDRHAGKEEAMTRLAPRGGRALGCLQYSSPGRGSQAGVDAIRIRAGGERDECGE
jgi:hypothetical protein